MPPESTATINPSGNVHVDGTQLRHVRSKKEGASSHIDVDTDRESESNTTIRASGDVLENGTWTPLMRSPRVLASGGIEHHADPAAGDALVSLSRGKEESPKSAGDSVKTNDKKAPPEDATPTSICLHGMGARRHWISHSRHHADRTPRPNAAPVQALQPLPTRHTKGPLCIPPTIV